jgi:hypothetical protein
MAIPELNRDEDIGIPIPPIVRFDWRLSVWGGVGALIVLFPTLIFGNDIGTLLATLGILAIVSLVLLIFAALKIRRQTLAAMSMLFIFCSVSWLCFKTSNELRYAGRWLFRSAQYKSLVMAQPVAAGGELQHIEWDGWGFAGGGTVVYLIYDPSNSLRKETKLHTSGKFSGIPCKVPKIQRLEDHWYSAMFYTDDFWDYCN